MRNIIKISYLFTLLMLNYGVRYISAAEQENLENLYYKSEQGDPHAQTKLGIILSSRMVCTDDFTAIELFRKSANQNNAESQFRLGLMHNNGRATAQNSGEAHMWFQKAASQGNIDARCALNLRNNGISSQSIINNLNGKSIQTLDLAGNNVGNQGLKLLSDNLPELYTLNALHLKNNNITDLEPLAQSLPKSSITILDLWNNLIAAQGIEKFSSILSLTNVQILDFAGNNLGDAGIKILFKNLPGTHVHTLHIGENHIGAQGAEYIAASLPDTDIHTLDLGRNSLGEVGMAVLSPALCKAKLRILDVAENNIGEQGATFLAQGIINTSIKSLDVKNNNIGDAGAQFLAECISKMPLEALNIRNNKINLPGIKKIAEAMPETIQILNASGNPMGDEGAQYFATHLINKPIKTLNLSGSLITSTGAFNLLSFLAKTNIYALHLGGNGIEIMEPLFLESKGINSTIRKLDLGGNNIGDNGIDSFAELFNYAHAIDLSSNALTWLGAKSLLKMLATVQVLNLAGNKIGPKGIEYLSKYLPETPIHTLNLAGNKITDDGLKIFSNYLPKTLIQILNLSDNDLQSSIEDLALILPDTSIYSLDLERNNIQDKQVKILAGMLSKSKLRILSLKRNKFGDAGAEAILSDLDKTQVHTLYLSENDVKVSILQQLAKAKKFNRKGRRIIAQYPSIMHDLSVAVPNDFTNENLKSIVKASLGSSADLCQKAEIISEVLYEHLLPQVIERLGMKPGQKNVLFRVTFSSAEKILEKNETKIFIDQIYRSVHQGTNGYYLH